MFLGWEIDGVMYKEAPEWVKEKVTEVLAEVNGYIVVVDPEVKKAG